MNRITGCSVVLALIFAISAMLTFSVGALSFTDRSQIGQAYTAAVDGMTDRGVLSGYPDGSFRPDGTLTREQGAKIIAYIVLGSQADRLTCSSAPFFDVSADRWSAPYIEWCVGKGILLGYGGGMYGPEDTLTGFQFAKMLLCALGLNGGSGDYSSFGADWTQAVEFDGVIAGIYEGDYRMASGNNISRQQAALMAYNSIKAAGSSAAFQQPSQPTQPTQPTQPSQPINAGEDVPSLPDPANQPLPSQPVQSDGGGTASGYTPEIIIPSQGSTGNGDSGSGNTGSSSSGGTESSGGNEGSGSQSSGQQNSDGDIVLPEIPAGRG